MADKQAVLSEIGDSIVRFMNDLQTQPVTHEHTAITVQLTSTLALAYAYIDHGAGQLIVNAGPAPNLAPPSPGP